MLEPDEGTLSSPVLRGPGRSSPARLPDQTDTMRKHIKVETPEECFPKAGEPPEWLWHYTQRPGLLGVVGERRVRASDLWYLNDSKEILLTADIACEILDQLGSQKATSTRDREICEELRGFTEWLNTPQKVYAFSLSERVDDLGQWRAYGRPGSSYALGFKTAILKDAATAHGFTLLKCIYDARRQRRIIRALLLAVIQALRAAPRSRHRSTWSDIHLNFVLCLLWVAPYLKHSKFADEREWRLVFSSDVPESASHFCDRGSLLTPYVELPAAPARADFGIRRIIVGPSPHPELEWDAVHRLIAAAGHPSCAIESSAAPFRTW